MKNIILALFGTICLTACEYASSNNFNTKGTHHIKAKKGDIITFSLPQNKSTGYELCWLNEAKLENKIKLKEIKSKLIDHNNVDGGGETITYHMQILSTGNDTLHFKNCPTRLWQKDCHFFAVDSNFTQENGNIKGTYEANPKGDYQVIIEIE